MSAGFLSAWKGQLLQAFVDDKSLCSAAEELHREAQPGQKKKKGRMLFSAKMNKAILDTRLKLDGKCFHVTDGITP